MGAISALSTTSRTLKRNTVLFAVALVFALVTIAPSGASAFLSPSVTLLVSLLVYALLFFVSPFFFGGLLAMASEGIHGTTGFDTFVKGGKANYLSLFGAMLLFGLLVGILASIATVGVGVVGVFAVGMNSAGAAGMTGGAGSLGILALLGLLGGLLVLLPVFFLQFYAPAIVVSDLGIVGSLKRSASVVRRNFVSTLGYSTIAGLFAFLSWVAGFLLSMASGIGRFGATEMLSPEFGAGLAVAVVVVSALISSVVAAFSSVYQVAFYEDCLESLD